jgi:carbonic anhydrase
VSLRPSLSLLILLPLILFGVDQTPSNSDTALKKLMEGNNRYVNDASIHPSDLGEKREETFNKQMPFAVVLGCSDSRVSPEIVFDQTIGDIFVVRVAGNVIGSIELDSIEFAVDKLETPLVVILGHQKCGAVSAVLSGKELDDIENIAPYIKEAVDETKHMPGNPLVNAIKANVEHGIKELKKNRIIAALLKAKKLQIVGAYYDLESGKVEILGNRAPKK